MNWHEPILTPAQGAGIFLLCLAVYALGAFRSVIPYYTVTDAGRSEVEPGTKTVCLFGPAYREELPPFLKRLQVLKGPSHDA